MVIHGVEGVRAEVTAVLPVRPSGEPGAAFAVGLVLKGVEEPDRQSMAVITVGQAQDLIADLEATLEAIRELQGTN